MVWNELKLFSNYSHSLSQILPNSTNSNTKDIVTHRYAFFFKKVIKIGLKEMRHNFRLASSKKDSFWEYPFKRYAEFSKKLKVKNVSFSERCTRILNGWSLFKRSPSIYIIYKKYHSHDYFKSTESSLTLHKKMIFSIKEFFSKFDQICSYIQCKLHF